MDRLQLRTKLSSRIEPFRLEEFDLDVHLRRLSALARARLGDAYKLLQESKASSAENAVVEIQCRVVAQGLVDEHGARIYQDAELAAIAEEFPATALDQLSSKILAISGLGVSTEELAKNSQPAPSVASPSA